MSVKINTLEVENVKRVKTVRLSCEGRAMTVIGGKNGEGKTSVLDAICYALGGERYRPSGVKRDASITPPAIRVELSNGVIVERKGKNSALKVMDPKGGRGGQQLLDAFVSQFALDLPRFMQAPARDKADALLRIIGVGEQLAKLEAEEKRVYDQRHAVGQVADQKRKFADELPYYPDAPDAPVTATELIQAHSGILARNGDNQAKRANVLALEQAHKSASQTVILRGQRVADLKAQLAEAEQAQASAWAAALKAKEDVETARKTAEQLKDESTAEIEAKLREIDGMNVKVRANLDKAKAIEDADANAEQYADLTAKLDALRNAKADLLNGASLPLPNLSVDAGELVFNGQKWDCMSGSEQLRVATAIARKLNPECGFVLLDKLEQMDLDTLSEFGAWLETEGLQVIATRVSTGGECSIILEDGTGILEATAPRTAPAFTPGTF